MVPEQGLVWARAPRGRGHKKLSTSLQPVDPIGS